MFISKSSAKPSKFCASVHLPHKEALALAYMISYPNNSRIRPYKKVIHLRPKGLYRKGISESQKKFGDSKQ